MSDMTIEDERDFWKQDARRLAIIADSAIATITRLRDDICRLKKALHQADEGCNFLYLYDEESPPPQEVER